MTAPTQLFNYPCPEFIFKSQFPSGLECQVRIIVHRKEISPFSVSFNLSFREILQMAFTHRRWAWHDDPFRLSWEAGKTRRQEADRVELLCGITVNQKSGQINKAFWCHPYVLYAAHTSPSVVTAITSTHEFLSKEMLPFFSLRSSLI